MLEAVYAGNDPLRDFTFDSLALEQLLSHLEEVYKLLFDGEETARANLNSVAQLASVVEARLRRVDAGEIPW